MINKKHLLNSLEVFKNETTMIIKKTASIIKMSCYEISYKETSYRELILNIINDNQNFEILCKPLDFIIALKELNGDIENISLVEDDKIVLKSEIDTITVKAFENENEDNNKTFQDIEFKNTHIFNQNIITKIKNVKKGVSKNNGKTDNVLIKIFDNNEITSENYHIVATDGKRLYMYGNLDMSQDCKSIEYILPPVFIKHLTGGKNNKMIEKVFLNQSDEYIKFMKVLKNGIVESYTLKEMVGNIYSQYMRVIPTNNNYICEVNTNDIKNIIKELKSLYGLKKTMVKISILDNMLILKCDKNETQYYKKIKLKNIVLNYINEIFMDLKYLYDFITFLENEITMIELPENNHYPIKITNEQYLAVIMPLIYVK